VKVTVVEFAGKGGLIHYAFQLCRAMQQEGADVTLVTSEPYELEHLQHDYRLDRSLRLWDPKSHGRAPLLVRKARRAARAGRYYREWLRLAGLVAARRPDVVQFGDIRFAADALPLSLVRRRTPIMADICHNVRPFSGGQDSTGTFSLSAAEQSLYRRAYRLFDAIFVHYTVNVAEFSRTFPASAERVVPIVHGNEEIFSELADGSQTPQTIRKELGIADSQRIVLFFGTLSAYKGLDLLLDIFERVARAMPEAVLVLAGFPLGDFSVEEYRAEADRRGFGNRLRIVDRYIDSGAVVAWMQLADAIVFPYRTVYQSGALHVAQTFGAPIVATGVGAMPEVITDRESGLLVPPGDAAAFAAAVTELLRNRELAQMLGNRAAAEARTRFSWRSVARTMLDRYESLLSRGGR
jgi:glycosyltransferase involved in cell wall biosynthesis